MDNVTRARPKTICIRRLNHEKRDSEQFHDAEIAHSGFSKIQLESELHLPALVDGVGDLSKSGQGQLHSWFIKLRRIEKVNELSSKVERALAWQAEASANRGIPISSSIFSERIHTEIAPAAGRNIRIEILAMQVREAVRARGPASTGAQ